MLTLFTNVSVKYEDIVVRNLTRHIEMCLDPISEIFLVCNPNVDQDKLIKSLPLPTRCIDDNEAVKRMNLTGTKNYKLREDKRMMHQLAKLYSDVLTGRERIIHTEPDCVQLRPFRYIEDSKDILYYSDPFTAWPVIEKYIFPSIETSYDFLTEMMLVNHSMLESTRELIKTHVYTYAYRRHTWYDISLNEYNVLKGESWPSYTEWDKLPRFVQDEIKEYVEGKLIETEWNEGFSDYQIYGYNALVNHPDQIRLKPLKIQNGPFGDGTATIFLNRPSERNSVAAFNYVFDQKKIV